MVEPVRGLAEVGGAGDGGRAGEGLVDGAGRELVEREVGCDQRNLVNDSGLKALKSDLIE